MDKRIVIALSVVTAFVCLFSFVFFNIFFVRYEKEIKTMPSIEAIKNPFLAAERFLNKTGMDAQSVSNRRILIDLPGRHDIIIINRFGGNLPKKREDLLISWIRSGGSLIIAPHRNQDKKLLKSGNNLLDRFNIKPLFDLEDDNGDGSCDCAGRKSVSRIDCGNGKSADVSFLKARTIITGHGSSGEDKWGNNNKHIVEKNLGQGRLIVLSDNAFLKNGNIGKNDHAYFLSCLVQNGLKENGRSRSKIWLLYSGNMPSLLSMIWDKAHYFIICLMVLLLFIILRLNLKTGPMLPEEKPVTRNLMEHLEASGNFLFKIDKGNMMLKEVQKLAKRSLQKKYFIESITMDNGSKEDNFKRFAFIAKQMDIPPERLHNALFGNVENEHDFIKKTMVLHDLIQR